MGRGANWELQVVTAATERTLSTPFWWGEWAEQMLVIMDDVVEPLFKSLRTDMNM